MNTAGTLTGCGGRQDLILVRFAKVLMETEIGIINGEVNRVAIPKIISVKNARAWVSMISYLQK